MYPGGNRLNERTWSIWLQRCASLTAAACIAQHGNQLVVQALDLLSNVICSFGSPYVSTAWPWDMAEDGGRLEKWSVPAKTATPQLDVAVTFHEARICRQKPICESPCICSVPRQRLLPPQHAPALRHRLDGPFGTADLLPRQVCRSRRNPCPHRTEGARPRITKPPRRRSHAQGQWL